MILWLDANNFFVRLMDPQKWFPAEKMFAQTISDLSKELLQLISKPVET